MPITTQKQQAGRAGRRSRDSLAVMLADPFPIDQHYVQNPSDLFENAMDDLILDVENELVLEGLYRVPFHLVYLTYVTTFQPIYNALHMRFL